MPRAAALLVLFLLIPAGGATLRSATADDSRWHCRIHGVVTHDGRPVKAALVATRYAGVETLAHWRVRVPGYVAPVLSDDEEVVRGTTDEQGAYMLEGLAPGCYAVRASDHAGRVAEAILIFHQDGMRSQADLALIPGRSFEGQIRWAAGQPVAGRISLTEGLGGPSHGSGPYNPWSDAEDELPYGPERTLRLDEQGRFRFEGLLPGRHVIRVETVDGLVLHGWQAWRSTEKPLNWTVKKPTLVVTGRLIDAATHRPIAAARVEARPQRGSTPRVVTRAQSGADGSFRLPVGSLPSALKVMADGYLDLDEAASAKDLGELRLTPAGRISGRVLASEGTPAAGALVRVVGATGRSRPSELREATTGPDGRFTVAAVPSGDRIVFVRGGGWVSKGLADVQARGRNPLLVPETARADLELRVDRAATIRGTVLDPQGAPLVGARVRAIGTLRNRSRLFESLMAQKACVGPAVVPTDVTGQFVLFDLVPGLLYEIRITSPGLGAVRLGPHPLLAKGLSLSVRMSVPRWLDVLVLDDATSKPLSGVSATLYVEDGRPRWIRQPPRARSGEDGRLRFGPIGEGQASVRLHCEGYIRPQNHFQVSSSGPDGHLKLTARLEPGQTIEGKVVDAKGAAVPEISVRAEGVATERHIDAFARTDAAGLFVLKGLLPGLYKLSASSSPGRDPTNSLQAKAGARSVVLALSEQAGTAPIPFLVRLRGPSGEVVPRARVWILSERGTAGASARDGQVRFELDSTRFGGAPLHVVVTGPRSAEDVPLALGRSIMGPVPSGTREVEIRLVAETVIEGVVTQADGTAVAGARVRVTAPAALGRGGRPPRMEQVGMTLSDANGHFRIDQLGEGIHSLMVEAGGDFVRPGPVQVKAGTGSVAVRLQHGLSVQLLLRDEEDKPVVAARLRLRLSLAARSAGGSRPRAWRRLIGRSAADGSIILRGLPPDCTFWLEVIPGGARPDLQVLRLPEWTPADGVLRLERGMVIAGEVRDATGELAKDADIRIRGEQMSGGLGVRGGRFHRGRLVPGTYTLTARSRDSTLDWDDDRLPSVTVADSRMDIVLQLPKP